MNCFNRGRLPARPVYHYTSFETFAKILDSQRIRLTDARTLNDASEVGLGLRVVLKALRDAQPRGEHLKTLLDRVRQSLPQKCRSTAVFIACFSAKRDKLSQWRAYGDDGRGVAVGFNLSSGIAKTFNTPFSSYQVLKVRYGNKESVKVVTDFLNCVAKKPFPANTGGLDTFLAHWLLGMVYCTKHIGFSEEEEWRLVMTEDKLPPNIEIRCRQNKYGELARYIDFERQWGGGYGSNLPIRDVVLGPRSICEASGTLGKTLGLDGLVVRRSDIPYRG